MDEQRFGLLLVLIIASVGLVGLFGGSITGNLIRIDRGLLDTNSLYERWSSNCDKEVQNYNELCGETISGSGVQKVPNKARCTMLRSKMVSACENKDAYAKRLALPTGAAVADVGADAESDVGGTTVAGFPLSAVVVVGIGGLFLYFRRRQTR
ncbi:MAG: hypothetical protein Q7R76_03835 [Candidatus Woesearchaeota archaeon]|nr:hypothetical protein [Candidatus Woesearchaeota archaeon]